MPPQNSRRSLAPSSRAVPTRTPTFARIVDVAAELFATRGYHATSIQDICDAVGLGKGALYYHIGRKQNLLFEIHNAFVDPAIAAARQLLDQDLASDEMLRLLGRRIFRILRDFRPYVVVFYRELDHLDTENRQDIVRKRREFETIMKEILHRGKAARTFRDVDDVAVFAFLGMYNYAYVWYRRDDRLSSDAIADTFSDIFLRGVRRLPGESVVTDSDSG